MKSKGNYTKGLISRCTNCKDSDIIFVPIQTPHNKKYEGINDIPKTRKDFD